MPYNTSAIPRPEEVTGTSALPLARIKKIIAQDEDIAQCSNGAAFAISVATEEFLRYLTEQAYNVAKSESKPRKNIQYRDIAGAVSKLDNLQFLSDTVPKTMTYKQVKEIDKKAKTAAADKEAADAESQMPDDSKSASKQRSISHMMKAADAQTNGTKTNGIDGDEAPSSPSGKRISLSMATSPIVDRTVQHHPKQNGHTNESADDDVEMVD